LVQLRQSAAAPISAPHRGEPTGAADRQELRHLLSLLARCPSWSKGWHLRCHAVMLRRFEPFTCQISFFVVFAGRAGVCVLLVGLFLFRSAGAGGSGIRTSARRLPMFKTKPHGPRPPFQAQQRHRPVLSTSVQDSPAQIACARRFAQFLSSTHPNTSSRRSSLSCDLLARRSIPTSPGRGVLLLDWSVRQRRRERTGNSEAAAARARVVARARARARAPPAARGAQARGPC
jgi:hypothetical protein